MISPISWLHRIFFTYNPTASFFRHKIVKWPCIEFKMRPMLFKKSWNLSCSNVVKHPVNAACFIWSYLHNLVPYNHVTITETSYHKFNHINLRYPDSFCKFSIQAKKIYLMYYLGVIDLFSTGLHHSVSSTYSFRKLVFSLSIFIIIAACCLFWVWYHL